MASLTDLPVEILDQICSSLCCHCRQHKMQLDKPSAAVSSTEDDGERLGLRNLCLTSRSLRQIAQPILFHVFLHHCTMSTMNWTSEETNLIPRLFQLLRTINEDAHLSSCLKSIDINAFEEKCIICSPSLECATQEEISQVTRLSKKTGLDINPAGLDHDLLPEILIQFLLIMTPNLQNVSLCVPRWWVFYPLRKWINKWRPKLNESKILLGQVRHMELETERYSDDTCLEDDHKDEGLCHPIPDPIERLLIDSAPNLEVLSCSAGGLEGLPKLPLLRWLHLRMEGSWKGMLPILMDRLPSLTHFSYSTSNLHSPTPREIQDALHNHQETLQHLTVINRFGESIASDDLRTDPSRPYSMTSLAGFKALKSINLDGYMIWPHRRDGGTIQEMEADLQLLPNFLPQCLRQLHIDGWGNYGEENLRSLAKAMANVEFPYLETVIWGIVHDRRLLRRGSCNKAWEMGMDWREIITEKVEDRIRNCHQEAFPNWGDDLLGSAANEAG
ncbi:hypothetical protein CABS01_00811 [Colletotrichum abscissum]|uniref:uncharacterized protein n=1 Tax=Colletotrichum abscissum TaxID=1671311 RepID=UPI0027D56DBA|nr:uncharacterized protein CABS01_00811 [Colletotrichum abscissum]KAK1505343.1 hypothetical protein CABS01_00811 [Colletotrichum abscissum]